MSAKKIHFTDSKGNFLFEISDGDFLRLDSENGDTFYALCQYVSETEVKIDGRDQSIREFASCMEKNRIQYIPL